LRFSYPEIVQTSGVINSDADRAIEFGVAQNGITKVSGSAFFTLDIRSSVTHELENYKLIALAKVKEVAERFNVDLNIIDLGLSKPMESLSKDLGLKLEQICIAENIPYTFMPSGAGHDALVVARQKQSSGDQVPVAMLFIPCKGGVSHDPLEYASFEDLGLGTSVLEKAIATLQA
jgi:acetylornithine deacetylase/succinyl-diaminopimelate desuccinylase-like protein